MIASLLITFVRIYKTLFSSLLPFNQCRYIPTCSEYAIEALEKHGAAKGSILAARRILRCHPYTKKFGYDPVP
jgi:putative membrane protein insertion efficiency factor